MPRKWNELCSCIKGCDLVAILLSMASASQAGPSSSSPQVHPQILWEGKTSLKLETLICESRPCVFKPWSGGSFGPCFTWDGQSCLCEEAYWSLSWVVTWIRACLLDNASGWKLIHFFDSLVFTWITFLILSSGGAQSEIAATTNKVRTRRGQN